MVVPRRHRHYRVINTVADARCIAFHSLSLWWWCWTTVSCLSTSSPGSPYKLCRHLHCSISHFPVALLPRCSVNWLVILCFRRYVWRPWPPLYSDPSGGGDTQLSASRMAKGSGQPVTCPWGRFVFEIALMLRHMLWVNSIMSPGPVRMSDYSSYRFFLYEGPIVMAAEKKAAMVPDRDLVGRLLHADGRFVLLCFSLTYVCTIFVQKEFPFFFICKHM
jgi:hypothetical protein